MTRWHDLLAETALIQSRIVLQSRIVREPHVASIVTGWANTSVMRPLSGDGWWAVGDSAFSLDPLSEQGVQRAGRRLRSRRIDSRQTDWKFAINGF